MLQYTIMDKKLNKSLVLWSVNDEWQEVMENYLLRGFEPGSFFTAVLVNDLMGAALHSHPSNRWDDIRNLCKWLNGEAPKECFGSYKAVSMVQVEQRTTPHNLRRGRFANDSVGPLERNRLTSTVIGVILVLH